MNAGCPEQTPERVVHSAADCRPAGLSDDFKDAVDYRAVTKKVLVLVEDSSFFLVEKLAAEIAEICLEDERVEMARVRVEKPGAE